MKTLLLIVIMFCRLSASAETIDEIFDKMEKNQKPMTQRSEITQTIYLTSGEERQSRLISYGKDGSDKGLMEYISPARIKGMKMLMLNEGDDIWFYSPRTARVRKIASHQRKQSVNGSDFSYEDFSANDMRDDYETKLVGTEKIDDTDCYKIKLTAKDKDKTYSSVNFWVDKERYIPLKAEYFDEDRELWKVLTMQGFIKIKDYWTAKTIEMKNVQKGSRTVMIMDKIEYDIPMDDMLFSQRNLKK
ncbi:MAG: outer membrane lipoprotein-sorting protein [bacterium]